MSAFVVLFAYYLLAARGLLSSAGVFFGDGLNIWWIGVAIWTGSSAVLASVWALFWGRDSLFLRIAGLMLALALPPVGLIGWANPLTAAGALFPAWGWAGLVLTLTIFWSIARKRVPLLVFVLAPASLAANVLAPEVLHPPLWIEVDTTLGRTERGHEYDRMVAAQSWVLRTASGQQDGAVLLMPEFVGGEWTDEAVWWDRTSAKLEKENKSALVGVSRRLQDGRLLNVTVSIGATAGVEWVARVPVPIAMWRPWAGAGYFVSAWSGSGVQEFRGLRVASLICYEQLLVWPALASMVATPDVVIAPANGWWAKDTSIPSIQRQAVGAWGRLFRVPVLSAHNS